MTSENHPNPSTPTLHSDASSVISSATLTNPRPNPPQKDYAAAFGVLQSRYGSGGGTLPSPKTHASKKLVSNSSQPGTPDSSVSTLRLTPIPSPNSESSGGSSSTANASSEDRAKSKNKTSFLKAMFKGKAKESKPAKEDEEGKSS